MRNNGDRSYYIDTIKVTLEETGLDLIFFLNVEI